MTEQQLREMWKKQDEVKGEHALSHSALAELTVCHNHGGPPPGTRFVVIRLGEGLAYNWQSDDIIAFWEDGEHTALDGLEFEVLVPDLWGKE